MKQREKYLASLSKEQRAIIIAGLQRISAGDTAGMNIKKMVGTADQYRRKINQQLRLLYSTKEGAITVEKI